VTKLRTGRTLAAAAVLMASLAGCGGSSGHTFVSDGQPTPGPVSTRPVNSFEIYLFASAEGNPLFADVYGLTLSPFHVERLTSGKRISTMDANAEHLVVAAADSDVGDRLGYVSDGGAITDIPGLGRPEAFTPKFAANGDLVFSDVTRNGSGQVVDSRSFRFDLGTHRKTLLMQAKDIGGAIPLSDGRFAYLNGHGQLLIEKGHATVKTIRIPDTTQQLMAHNQLAALEQVGQGSNFGDKPTDTVLLDLKTGRQHTVPGWQPICWNPDGTKLLVRRTSDNTDSELALLDPNHPDATPAPLGRIPHLMIYRGAWVARH